MTEAKVDPLWDAVSRNAAVVLSLPSPGDLRHHKTRFLAKADEGFWVQMVAEEPELIEALAASQQPAGISFRSGNKRFVFGTPLIRRDEALRINDDVTADALLLRTPSSLRVIQRRSNYRVHCSVESGLAVRVWRMEPGTFLRDRTLPSQEIQAELRDLSVGGMGVNLFASKDGQPPRISPADRLKVQLTLDDVCLLVEGTLRYPREIPPDAKVVRAGIQFRILHSSMEGRQTVAVLTRVLGQLQRTELRRLRLGLPYVG